MTPFGRRAWPSGATLALLITGALLFLTAPARANGNDDARLALHLLPVQPGNACGSAAAQPGCGGVLTAGQLEPHEYFAYVLVMKGNATEGIAGLQFGITYDGAPTRGVDIYYWNSCTTLQFPMANWPGASSGNLLTWDFNVKCQRAEPDGPGTGVVAVAGYFYLGAYSPDVLRLTPRPVDGMAKVVDCGTATESLLEGGAVHHDPSVLGYASFSVDGSVPGYNPCAAPTVVSCAISGPDPIVRGTAGNIYAAISPPAGAGFAWTVGGSGTLVGSHAGASAEVRAGTGGSLTVELTVTDGASAATCERLVTLVDPTCGISGPDSLDVGDIQSYLASTNLPRPGYAWSVRGDATPQGGVNGSTLTLRAGDTPGPVELTAEITGGGVTTTCRRTIGVRALRCLVTGAGTVNAYSAANAYSYTRSGNLVPTAWSWSIDGNGTLAGPADQPTVLVDAGEPGQFELSLALTLADGSVLRCTRRVDVAATTCVVTGPTSVTAGATGLLYDGGPALSGATWHWSITGNATIAGRADGRTVTVNAGAAGSFTLLLAITRAGATTYCGLSVLVTPAGGCVGGRQGNAKILVHLRGRTAKNPCGLGAPRCGSVVTRGKLYPELYFAYLLVTDGAATSGVGGLECGVDYAGAPAAGVDVFSWSLCATVEAPVNGWPLAGGGNRILWDGATRCQRAEPGGAGSGVVATAGYFYMGAYTPDDLRVTVHPANGAARVLDCESCESIVAPVSGFSHLGTARFSPAGDLDGYNPCAAPLLPVVPTTWSSIKAMYATPPAKVTSP